MGVSIGLVCNFFNEAHALPGFFETHTPFFDHILMYQSGPGGEESSDGSIEIIEKWGIPIARGSIDMGFGIVRTAAVRSSPCDWVMILDADERFFHTCCVLTCSGESTPAEESGQVLNDYDKGIEFTACPSNWENAAKLTANLSVRIGDPYAQGAWIRDTLNQNQDSEMDGVRTIRRHWHDFTMKRPTQNWHTDSDMQCRIIRNHPDIYFAPDVRMHESLIGVRNLYAPNMTHGPFFDHFHLHFKKMSPAARAKDIEIYRAIARGEKPATTEK